MGDFSVRINASTTCLALLVFGECINELMASTERCRLLHAENPRVASTRNYKLPTPGQYVDSALRDTRIRYPLRLRIFCHTLFFHVLFHKRLVLVLPHLISPTALNPNNQALPLLPIDVREPHRVLYWSHIDVVHHIHAHDIST
jgi:hypothetical protein